MILTISKTKLKAKMFAIFRQVKSRGQALIITDHGKLVLRLTPFKRMYSVEQLFGDLAGKVTYLEDLNQPDPAEWEET